MADYPQEPTSDEQLRNLQDQVRRLWTKMPKNADWPWYSLRPYLSGGWMDRFSSHPFRNLDGVLDPADVTDKAGFFDTGQALIFSGNIYWDPDSWYSVDPYDPGDVADPAKQGDPPIYKDSQYILGIVDGLGKGISEVAEDNDLGLPLPYQIPEQGSGVYTLPLSSDKHFATAVGWLNGAVLSFTPLQETGGFVHGFNWNVFHSLVGHGTNGDVTDPDGFVHDKMPAATSVVSLNGLIIRYVKKLDLPTGIPGHPRDYDNFIGVDMNHNVTGLVGG